MEPSIGGEAVERMTSEDHVESAEADAIAHVAPEGRPPHVEIVDFGDCGIPLLAEYDAECDTIRVNARAVERVRSAAGEEQAAAFVACAIAHERFHRAHPQASEAAAHEHVYALVGDPLHFEAWVRGAVDEHA